MDSFLEALVSVIPPTTSIHTIVIWVFLILLAIIIIIGAITFVSGKDIQSTPQNVKQLQDIQKANFQEFFDKATNKDRKSLDSQRRKLPDNENCLMNFQPLTVIQPGYLGPEQNGVFSVRDGVATALKLGARCLVLPIDYYSGYPAESFSNPDKPCFVYRDDGGVIRSLNPGSLREAIETINELAFSDLMFQKNDPMILVLYFINTPPPDTKEYVLFLSAVAKDISFLSSRILTQTSKGKYFRQQQQTELLFEPVESFYNKCLIFCNIDTSIFRNQDQLKNLGLVSFQAYEDLDYLVHLQLFKQNKDVQLGKTLPIQEKSPAKGLVEKVQYFSVLSDDDIKNTVVMTKEKWVMAISPEKDMISADSAKKLLNTYGVQSIPLPLYTSKNEELTKLLDLWNISWRTKPAPLRYIKPSLVVPTKQDPATNANGGSLNVST